MEVLFVFVAIVVFVLHGLFWGFIVSVAADKRGHNESFFIWGFFLGWVGLLIVLAKEPVFTAAPANTRYLSKKLEEEKFKTVRTVGDWECICGRINQNYVGTCACGRTKAEVMNYRTRKPEPEVVPVPVPATEPVPAAVAEPVPATEPASAVVIEPVPVAPAEPVSDLPPVEVTGSTPAEEKVRDTIPVSQEMENLQLIKVLKELLDSGAITQEEYDLKKKQLLGL